MLASKDSGPFRDGNSLLDRMTDRTKQDIASVTIERGELPVEEIQDGIRRDLCWLLNTTCLASSRDLARWPHVRQSVLNFGVKALHGRLLSQSELPGIARSLTQAITTFEPRFRTPSVDVQLLFAQENAKQLCLKINAEYWQHGRWEWFDLNGIIDLDIGCIRFI